ASWRRPARRRRSCKSCATRWPRRWLRRTSSTRWRSRGWSRAARSPPNGPNTCNRKWRSIRSSSRTQASSRNELIDFMANPIQIGMGGYGAPTTGFSKALKLMGDKLAAQFGDRVDVKYVWNIMDFGYKAEDILWLVESGVLTLVYQSSSYLTDRVPELS